MRPRVYGRFRNTVKRARRSSRARSGARDDGLFPHAPGTPRSLPRGPSPVTPSPASSLPPTADPRPGQPAHRAWRDLLRAALLLLALLALAALVPPAAGETLALRWARALAEHPERTLAALFFTSSTLRRPAREIERPDR